MQQAVAQALDLPACEHLAHLVGQILVVERLAVGTCARQEAQLPDQRASRHGSDEHAARLEDAGVLGQCSGRVGDVLDHFRAQHGPEAAIVSSRHLEIRRAENTFHLVDLDSTNGTYLDGERVTEALLQNHALITMGPGGPEFQFELEVASETDLDQTLRLPVTPSQLPAQPPGQASIVWPAPSIGKQDELLKEAVKRARQARRSMPGR